MSPACLSLALAVTLTSSSAVPAGPPAYMASVLYAGSDSSAAAGSVPADSVAADIPSGATLHAPDVPTLRAQPPLIQPIAVGVVSMVVGAYGGALLGDRVQNDKSYEFLPTGAILGYFIGETVLLPVGVHLGNARHGSFLGDLGISLLAHLGAIGLGSLGGGNGGVYLVGVAAQVAATVANERSTGAKHLRKEQAGSERP